MSQDIELWKRELTQAGWTAVRSTLWRDPNGGLHRGPYGAWCDLHGIVLSIHGVAYPNAFAVKDAADYIETDWTK